jgi:hypothetical protein
MMSASEPTATFNSGRDAQSKATPWVSSGYAAVVVARLREIAPYAALELILPGGSLMAILLWLYRRQKKSSLFGLTRYKTAVALGVVQSSIRMPARVYGTAEQHAEEALRCELVTPNR